MHTPAPDASRRDEFIELGRFRIAWMQARGLNEPPGYAVFDHGRRITMTWKTLEEAQRHLDAIARIYQHYGW